MAGHSGPWISCDSMMTGVSRVLKMFIRNGTAFYRVAKKYMVYFLTPRSPYDAKQMQRESANDGMEPIGSRISLAEKS